MNSTTIERLLKARETRQPLVLLKKLESGDEALVYPNEIDKWPGLKTELMQAFREDRSKIVTAYETDYFVQAFNPSPRLFVIGAVHVTQQLLPQPQIDFRFMIVVEPITHVTPPTDRA